MGDKEKTIKTFRESPVVEKVTRIVRIDPRSPLHVIVISPRPWWIRFHWVGDHSEPHYDAPDACNGCMQQQSVQERGYLLVSTGNGRTPFFLEFTAYSWDKVRCWADEQPSLMGLQLKARRERDAKNAPIYLEFLEKEPLACSIPDESPVATLMLLWELRKNKTTRRVNK